MRAGQSSSWSPKTSGIHQHSYGRMGDRHRRNWPRRLNDVDVDAEEALATSILHPRDLPSADFACASVHRLTSPPWTPASSFARFRRPYREERARSSHERVRDFFSEPLVRTMLPTWPDPRTPSSAGSTCSRTNGPGLPNSRTHRRSGGSGGWAQSTRGGREGDPSCATRAVHPPMRGRGAGADVQIRRVRVSGTDHRPP